MKKLIYFLIILFFSSLYHKAYTQHNNIEDLEYTIYVKAGFIWISVGEMSIKVSEDKYETILQLSAKTFKRWRALHDFEINIKSVVDNNTGLSISYVRHSRENDFRISDSIQFDQKNKLVFETIKEDNIDTLNYKLDLENNAIDILNSFYTMRNQVKNTNPGDHLNYNLFYSRHEYDFGFHIEKNEIKHIKKLGKKYCHLINVDAIKGLNFDDKSYLKMWVGVNSPYLPYMFESPFKIGKVRIVLKPSKAK